MEFKGKEKAKLKALAINHKVMFQIGHNGLTKNVIDNIFDNLRKYEVGRITVLKTSPETIDEISQKLSDLGITVVGKIGKVLSLYRESPELKDRITF
ncbi:MAG: YhbY family RNA-binding protein [Tenericutes bacterium]|nr:YhbY family RNA-binding protein [Mycoplasmatota bacterium]